MYVLNQASVFEDQIKLQKRDGTNEILEIRFDITESLVKKYRELQIQMMNLQKKQKENPGDIGIVEEVGKVVVELFSALFGNENVERIMAFYANDYTKMCAELFPYIQNVIVPEFQKILRQRKQAYKKRNWK